MVFLDLKKAFDTVSHRILLNKLGNFGFNLTTVEWFKSYLNNRHQYVRFNNINSETLPVCYGVPQGSILGPTLFSLYINDLAELMNQDNVLLYADDTVLYNEDPVKLQDMLDRTHKWCQQNLLTINCKKSQWMRTLIVSKGPRNEAFHLGRNFLEMAREYKYLGLVIDVELNFKKQRDALSLKVYPKLSFFRTIRKYIDVDTALTIYKSTVLPVIEYADFVFDHNIKYVNKKIQGLQNQGLYTVYNQHIRPYVERESTEILHQRANVYRLIHRRRLHLIGFAYTLSQNVNYLDIRDIRTRQHEGKLFRLYKLDHYRCGQDPTYRAMLEWNSLDVQTRNSTSKSMTIATLKKQIINPFTKVL